MMAAVPVAGRRDVLPPPSARAGLSAFSQGPVRSAPRTHSAAPVRPAISRQVHARHCRPASRISSAARERSAIPRPIGASRPPPVPPTASALMETSAPQGNASRGSAPQPHALKGRSATRRRTCVSRLLVPRRAPVPSASRAMLPRTDAIPPPAPRHFPARWGMTAISRREPASPSAVPPSAQTASSVPNAISITSSVSRATAR